ncbi:MAG: hypothetical protein QOJ66_2687 [Ilumatobacteraceae bacterium]|jgi:hypothetical protein
MREWVVRATAAGFLPFELIDPVPEDSSLSGLGGGSDVGLSVDITYLVGGRELTVATSTMVSAESDDLHSRRTVLDVVESMLEEPLVFPLRLTVTFEDRAMEVSVDGSTVTFKGIVVADIDRWSVSARLDPGTLVTIHSSGDFVPLVIRRRNDLAIKGLLTAE